MRKFYFLLAIFAILITSCQKGEINGESAQQEGLEINKELVGSFYTKEQLAIVNPDAINILTELEELSSMSRLEEKLKNKSKDISSFQILTNKIAYIEYKNYHSYTFQVVRENSVQELENIVISLKPDGSYKAKRILYNLSMQEIELLKSGEYVDLTGKIFITKVNYQKGTLSNLLKTSLEDAINSCPSGSCCSIHFEESQATGWTIAVAEVIDCENTGGGSTGSTSTSTTGSGSAGTGGGSTYIYTQPGMNTSYSGSTSSTSDPSSGVPDDPACFDNGDGSCTEFMTTPVLYTKCDYASMMNLDCTTFLQFEQDYKGDMSVEERAIYDDLSYFHQVSYIGNAQLAISATQDHFTNDHNGKGDAFRHAWWNAANVIDLGETLTERLATAHENKPLDYPYQEKEVEMDLFNNAVGRTIGFTLNITKAILEKINNGELRYLNCLDSEDHPAINSVLVPTNQ